MVFVPAGPFLMGSEEGREDEAPMREVYLDAFCIDKYEVTNAEYAKFLNAIGGYVGRCEGHDCVDTKVENPDSHIIYQACHLYTSPSPRDRTRSRMPSSA